MFLIKRQDDRDNFIPFFGFLKRTISVIEPDHLHLRRCAGRGADTAGVRTADA